MIAETFAAAQRVSIYRCRRLSIHLVKPPGVVASAEATRKAYPSNAGETISGKALCSHADQ
jgi:hypothetical protein